MKIILLSRDAEQIGSASMLKPRGQMPESITFAGMVFVHAPVLDKNDESCTSRTCYYRMLNAHPIRQLDAIDDVKWIEARREFRYEFRKR